MTPEIFYNSVEAYAVRQDVVGDYLKQLVFLVQNKTGLPEARAREIAIGFFKKHYKKTEVRYYERNEHGDREVKVSSLLEYVVNHTKSGNVILPTFTTYKNKDELESIHSGFTDMNSKRRSKIKKQMFVAKAAGDTELHEALDRGQNSAKTMNNSLSGTFGQSACILFNETGHSSLTSTTRIITSLSNASNEKLLAGNRYYARRMDVMNNLIFIASNCNQEEIQKAIEAYGLHIPTVDEVISVLKYSSDLYNTYPKWYEEKVKPFLQRMTPWQLAAIVYCGDLYHVRRFNDAFTRKFIDALIERVKGVGIEDATSKIHTYEESLVNFVHVVFYDMMRGYGKDYARMARENVPVEDLCATAQHIIDVLQHYRQFIRAFFVTDLLPSNSHRLKYMRRRVVVLSDTDSTCFTMDEWATWYNHHFEINNKTIAMAGCLSYIAAQAIIHQLAIVSRNMNVHKDNLHTLSMKNEFLWLVHAPTELSKHYFALTAVREGNVYAEPELELKGVHLKNSNIPQNIIEGARVLMTSILKSVAENQQLDLDKIVYDIVAIEDSIYASIAAGETEYLKVTRINDKEAYSLDELKSNYQHHLFWEEVFARKYGSVELPPYQVVKFPSTLKSKTALKQWVESIEDRALAERITQWLIKLDKSAFNTFYLSEPHVKAFGVPPEILAVVNSKKIVIEVTTAYRIILETLGLLLYPTQTIGEQFPEIRTLYGTSCS